MKRNTQSKQNMFRTIVVLLLMVMASTSQAQVFINLPQGYGLGGDWYTPVGDGIAVLAALGGAYLLGKRRKKE